MADWVARSARRPNRLRHQASRASSRRFAQFVKFASQRNPDRSTKTSTARANTAKTTHLSTVPSDSRAEVSRDTGLFGEELRLSPDLGSRLSPVLPLVSPDPLVRSPCLAPAEESLSERSLSFRPGSSFFCAEFFWSP